MYLVWYILLNIIIFCGFIFPVLYYVSLLDVKKSLNFNKNSKLSKSILFKNLFLEYKYFFNLNSNLNLSNFLILNLLNLKLFKFDANNYNPYLNYLVLNNSSSNNSLKLNFNYFVNYSSINYKEINLNVTKSTLDYKNLLSNFNLKENLLINVNGFLRKSISTKWVTKFSPSNFFKYVVGANLNKYTILFLRKNKVFNKGRYSRNRQYYRTGVYWCLYVNIIAVVGIYFWFYRFTMNFGYLWWLLYLFIMSFIVPKTIKFRLYNLTVLFNTYVLNFVWLSNLIKSIFLILAKILTLNINFIKNINIFYFKNFNFLYITSFLNIFFNFFKNLNLLNFRYLNLLEFKLINKII